MVHFLAGAKEFPSANFETISDGHSALYSVVRGALSRGIKWPGCEADNPPCLLSKLRMHGAVPALPCAFCFQMLTVFMQH